MSAEMLGLPLGAIDAFACTPKGLTVTAPDGRSVSLDDCAWMQVAPCDCVNAVTVTVPGDEVLLTADQAMRSLAENATDYKEDVRNGFRMVLVTWDDYRAEAGELFKHNCPHEPKWGIQKKIRLIDDTEWTRMGSARWDAAAPDGAHWSLSKWGSRWSLTGPSQGPGRYRGPYLGQGKLDEALTLASKYIAEHPAGLERVSS